MILIALAIFGCMIFVAAIVIGLIKRANRRMDEQNKEMETYLKQYDNRRRNTGDPGEPSS
jgi:hypothetical protein